MPRGSLLSNEERAFSRRLSREGIKKYASLISSGSRKQLFKLFWVFMLSQELTYDMGGRSSLRRVCDGPSSGRSALGCAPQDSFVTSLVHPSVCIAFIRCRMKLPVLTTGIWRQSCVDTQAQGGSNCVGSRAHLLAGPEVAPGHLADKKLLCSGRSRLPSPLLGRLMLAALHAHLTGVRGRGCDGLGVLLREGQVQAGIREGWDQLTDVHVLTQRLCSAVHRRASPRKSNTTVREYYPHSSAHSSEWFTDAEMTPKNGRHVLQISTTKITCRSCWRGLCTAAIVLSTLLKT